MQIYLARNNQQAGPYSIEQLNQMLASQQVLLTDLAWHQGMTDWKALGELTQGKLVYAPAGQVEAPFNPQVTVAQNNSIRKISVLPESAQELAPFYARFIAKFLDLSLWIPAAFILTAFFTAAEAQKFNGLNQQIMQLVLNKSTDLTLIQNLQTEIFSMFSQVAVFSSIGYLIVILCLQGFLIAKFGQSLGKKVTKIKIVDYTTGQKSNLTRAFFLRSIVFILPTIYFFPIFSFIDYLFSLGKNKQTLHDKLAKTKVIKE